MHSTHGAYTYIFQSKCIRRLYLVLVYKRKQCHYPGSSSSEKSCSGTNACVWVCASENANVYIDMCVYCGMRRPASARPPEPRTHRTSELFLGGGGGEVRVGKWEIIQTTDDIGGRGGVETTATCVFDGVRDDVNWNTAWCGEALALAHIIHMRVNNWQGVVPYI